MQKMASSSPKFVCIFFLLTTLLFSLQTYARDSQFFSKVTRNHDEDTTTTPNTNKFFINNKENDEFVHLNKQQEQEQPIFIPQTTETGYGLYGHETGLDPPSTTTSLYNMDENNNKNNNFDNNFNNYYKNNNEDHHEKNYAPELKGLSSTSTYGTNDVAPTKYINNNNNNFNNNFNDEGKFYEANKDGKYNYNGFNSEERYVPNNNINNNNDEGNKLYGARYNGMHEKQGMSDTRFMENGKYYYDVHNEETYNNPNNNYMSHTNNFNNNNNYENNNGYFGNKETNYVNNNNKFYKGNGMKGYQSQIPEEERFDFDEQP